MIIILVFIIIFVLNYNVKEEKLSNRKTESTFYKFIAALIVLNSHLVFKYGFREALLGACCVSFFLMISGYGLSYSFFKKAQTISMASYPIE